MEWVTHFDPEKHLVTVRVTGRLRAAPLRDMTLELRDLVRKQQTRQVLLDYTEAVFGLEPYEVFERPRVLEELGFPSDVKVAVLFQSLNEDTQFLENVYRNKGFPVRVFAEKPSAIDWLDRSLPK